MAYDLEEQEQLDSIKAWWAKYGNLVTWVLIIALAGYAGWTGWNTYQGRQSAQASVLYEEQQKSLAAKDNAKVQRAAADIQDKFSGTAYAQMSALVAAKSAFDANDADTAKKQLQWVIDHGRGKEYKAIAAVRLAGVLLDAKAYDEALKVLGGDYPAQFAGAIADRKGDVLLAQGKRDEARSAYKLALEKSDAKDPGRQLIQIKLDAIGGEAPKA
ncbi:tetratricopeptide repeat protein [Herbaspirillum seropedicae]|uniref:YfgM family protein n=1 Tax=Herbaspirillum seropedicae TaxID=964 RepID=UPI0002FB1AD9|nr:tetratricopeptide repeat protein [Herbaspirillum seropedicae]AKN66366.1 membrane protein [Herbaspirillum seropedicae]AON55184.1 membrane protein [Herbaspirillum seropedicae]MDR6393746.1 putative negative regulator of RcsB-dependent stress response [Herbaspirillum seropedicae]NQE30528.1 membrane protein [Herbaspirillum seropedicae]QDD65273.1 tetratricopeptide repeat protein [Herbaspirillum seropedicae]